MRPREEKNSSYHTDLAPTIPLVLCALFQLLVPCGALTFVAAFSGSYLLYEPTALVIPLRVSSEQDALGWI
jgi:hypothetical protein